MRELTDTTKPETLLLQQQAAVSLPIVVLRNFASKGDSTKHDVLWETLADWAAVLVENQVAHVVFVSDSITVTKPLTRALPNKPFNQVVLDDATPEASVAWLEARLAAVDQQLPSTSRPAVARLGGRQTDLELLLSKVNAGFTVEEGVDDIVARSATELRKSIFGDGEDEAKALKWTREQAWKVLVGLTKQEEVRLAAQRHMAFSDAGLHTAQIRRRARERVQVGRSSTTGARKCRDDCDSPPRFATVRHSTGQARLPLCIPDATRRRRLPLFN